MCISDLCLQGSHGGSQGTQLYDGVSSPEENFGPNLRAAIAISDVKAFLAFEDAFVGPAWSCGSAVWQRDPAAGLIYASPRHWGWYYK